MQAASSQTSLNKKIKPIHRTSRNIATPFYYNHWYHAFYLILHTKVTFKISMDSSIPAKYRYAAFANLIGNHLMMIDNTGCWRNHVLFHWKH